MTKVMALLSQNTLHFLVKYKEFATLFGIGKLFCNDNAAWIDLAEKNALYPPYILHKGDNLTISCQ